MIIFPKQMFYRNLFFSSGASNIHEVLKMAVEKDYVFHCMNNMHCEKCWQKASAFRTIHDFLRHEDNCTSLPITQAHVKIMERVLDPRMVIKCFDAEDHHHIGHVMMTCSDWKKEVEDATVLTTLIRHRCTQLATGPRMWGYGKAVWKQKYGTRLPGEWTSPNEALITRLGLSNAMKVLSSMKCRKCEEVTHECSPVTLYRECFRCARSNEATALIDLSQAKELFLLNEKDLQELHYAWIRKPGIKKHGYLLASDVREVAFNKFGGREGLGAHINLRQARARVQEHKEGRSTAKRARLMQRTQYPGDNLLETGSTVKQELETWVRVGVMQETQALEESEAEVAGAAGEDEDEYANEDIDEVFNYSE